jgi:nitrogen fixation protein NifB
MGKPGSISYVCFSCGALHPGSMLLHLATACNLQCRYCFSAREPASRRSPQRTGTTILTVEAAVGMVESGIGSGVPPSVVEIGGPGEPLLNAATFTILRQLRESYPDMPLSVWTNGVLLPDRLEDLVRAGASRLTISLPAATAGTAGKIYDWAAYRGRSHIGAEAAALVLQQQWNGFSNAVESGMLVTVYVSAIRGVNYHEVASVERQAEEIGAERVVIVPLGE